ncbi:hypothetical protein J8F10_16205 [Gemmata sp. G18]|uniref:Cytochrome c domain-containing protein n=1 Tax=Gemmata palustris TaxID=2822762 RepID=A0ABS5BTR8_9BACT|nr:hypothetical protein [Gemmata palustris]MBP3956817.1 hypothetical protein [Gemmata palustris]
MTTSASPAPFAGESAAKVFEERIAPIFQSPAPSSCTRCHLATVDIKQYILPSANDTFLALREQGLIDLDKPENSKILALINRGADDPKAAGLISAKRQRAEYEAFAVWIKACAADPALRGAPKPEKAPALATKPVEVVRHARKDRMLESFETNIWSLRFRCMNCHTEGTPQNDKLVKEHGARVAWFRKAGPEATMDYLLASKLIDLDKPEKSLLLTKPLNEVKHGGGVKVVVGDQGYKAIRAWAEDVASIKKGRYTKAADLPPKDQAPKQFGTEAWFRLNNTPAAWNGKLLQVDVYAWDAKSGAWEKDPIATSDRVCGDNGWQHTVTLLAAPGSDRAKLWAKGKPSLPAGKYLVKAFVDSANKAQKDWTARIGAGEFVGEAEFQGRWAEGYGSMTTVDAGGIKK